MVFFLKKDDGENHGTSGKKPDETTFKITFIRDINLLKKVSRLRFGSGGVFG
jgi:hypothetical protein